MASTAKMKKAPAVQNTSPAIRQLEAANKQAPAGIQPHALPPHVSARSFAGAEWYFFVLPPEMRLKGWPEMIPLGPANSNAAQGLVTRAWEIYRRFMDARLFTTGSGPFEMPRERLQESSIQTLTSVYMESEAFRSLATDEQDSMNEVLAEMLGWSEKNGNPLFTSDNVVRLIASQESAHQKEAMENVLLKMAESPAAQWLATRAPDSETPVVEIPKETPSP